MAEFAAALSPDDLRLVTLARSARARAGATQGAAVRDHDGRTYVAVGVDLPSLSVSALQLAVAMAVSSGAKDVEAAALVTAEPARQDPAGMVAVAELGGVGTPVILADADGRVLETGHA